MSKRWTDDEIIQAMRDWEVVFGKPPMNADWETSDPEGLYPTSNTVRHHFGSWRTAVALAFPPKTKRHPRDYWTKERIIEVMQIWADEHDGLPPARADFKLRNGLPNAVTVEKRFGSMHTAMKEAGLIIRPASITNRQIAKFLPFSRKPLIEG